MILSHNASAGLWVQKANFGGEARHRCTGFSIENKGYIGLGHINSGVEHVLHSDFWEYDPATDTWTQIADFGGGLRYFASSFVIDNKAYVGHGRKLDDSYGNDFWEYNPLTNLWTPIADFPGIARRGAASFTLNGEGYVGSGQSTAGYRVDFYKYNPQNNEWTQIANFIGAPRTAAVYFSHNGKGYVGTGRTNALVLNDFYEYDPEANEWTQKADVGGPTRQDATGFMVNGKGYIGTGNDVNGDETFGDMWEYDFDTDIWSQIEDFKGLKRRYLVSFVIGDVAYAGTGTNGTNFRDFWAFYSKLSINENNQEFFVQAYPNPSSDFINFSFPNELNNENIEIHIFNLNGECVLQKNVSENPTIIDNNNLNNGFYVYHILINNNSYHTGKIIFK